ncbi:MAG: MATE family efflux transporter [Epsilonproteobacteria bacterium]|nr:MAG: MATE family efflux transporter [Campylobacterota bacterium]RLA67761.1 MAG: MATE family efflux transporter [Campylobacterota bacterium]
MIEKDRLKRILKLSLPIIGGMVSQNIFNLVDTAMVGTLGNAALAAVGLGGFALFMSQSIILGISTGVLATSARRLGEGKQAETAIPLNGGIFLSIIVGSLLSLLFYSLTPSIYPFLNQDPEVIKLGSSYLQIRVLAIIFVGINFSFRGFWNAVNKPGMYMTTLVVMHVSNILLNYCLIFGKFGFPALGVDGAAIGSAISMGIGTLTYFFLGILKARDHGFLKALPSKNGFRDLIKISLPNGIQQLFFATGFTVLFLIIGKIGTVELAAAHILITVLLVCILPGMGLGIAAASLIGQALGKEDIEDAKKWGLDVVKIGMILLGILGLPLIFIPEILISIFIQDPLTIEIASWPMRLSGISMSIEAVGLIFMNSLLGAGDSKKVMVVTIVLQWMIFLPLAYLLGPLLGHGLLVIWLIFVSYRGVQSFIFMGMWKKGAWTKINL